MRKLVINIFEKFGDDEESRLGIVRDAGFNGFFSAWGGQSGRSDTSKLAELADKMGLDYQSVHAPFNHVGALWGDDEDAASAALSELLACLEDCRRAGVGLMVCHAFIGFKNHTPTEIGLRRFATLADAAEKAGVRLALENTEGIEYLEALMDFFADNPNVGFCWDSGHEMCYNHSRDMLAAFGDRLFGTHLNDNLGIRDLNSEITWLDDLHLLPFDGIADWQYNCDRLRACNFDGPLTFELNIGSKPGRHENDAYGEMPLRDYFAEALSRAKRFADLFRDAVESGAIRIP